MQRAVSSAFRVAVAAVLAALVAQADALAAERKYQVMRFDEDWTWLESQPPEKADAFDEVKHVALSDTWSFLLGGSIRFRVESDSNKTLGASPEDDDTQIRVRTFLNWELRHERDFRWFAEVRYSDTFATDRPVPSTQEDDPDVQNFFFEGTFASKTTHPVSVRVGRQELLLANQKILSPLDWSNTRRTWDGIAVIARTMRTKTTAFATRPVLHEEHGFDSPSDDVSFSGVTVQVRPKDGHVVEAFGWLLHDSSGKYVSPVTGRRDDVDRQSWGGRWEWSAGGWSGDVEGVWQTGDAAGDDIDALMIDTTAGYQWKDAKVKPKLSFGLDYASGDSDASDGDVETFDQLFPLSHAWLGHVDLVARKNIEAGRVQFECWPGNGWRIETALHAFRLAEEKDALYEATGTPIRRDPTGAAGDDVGTELDVLAAWTFKLHHTFSVEIARFWSGSFIERTGSGEDVWWGYIGYEFKF